MDFEHKNDLFFYKFWLNILTWEISPGYFWVGRIRKYKNLTISQIQKLNNLEIKERFILCILQYKFSGRIKESRKNWRKM